MTVRLGRRWARGRRFRRGTPELGVEETLAVLGDRASVARRLLSRAVRARGAAGVVVRPEEADLAKTLAEAGVVQLEERVEGSVIDYQWTPWRVVMPDDVRDEVAHALGRADPVAERSAVIAAARGEPLLEREVAALEAEAPEGPLRAPRNSVLEGAAWSVYAAAIRAAAIWASAEREAESLSSRELAARSLGWSKAWTPARRQAFAILVGRPFTDAVADTERFLRVSGPFQWSINGAEGDGRSGDPWVGLPERGIPALKIVEVRGRGVLVIENLETFEEVVRRHVVDDWIVFFGSGYMSESGVALIDRLRVPVAVWCDLDPHGVRIAADLERRLTRHTAPIAMEPALLASPYAISASDTQVSDARQAATALGEPWSNIANEIAATRRVCEQEALHAEVLGSLGEALTAI